MCLCVCDMRASPSFSLYGSSHAPGTPRCGDATPELPFRSSLVAGTPQELARSNAFASRADGPL